MMFKPAISVKNKMPRRQLLNSKFTRLLLGSLLLGFMPQAFGQERNEDDQRSRWEIPDDATSENSRLLKAILDRYPEADADKDGIIDAVEARAFVEKQRQQREASRDRNNARRSRFAVTFDNVKYGPDDKHHFDLYRAEGDGATPLVIFFHGGQFITGEEGDFQPFDIRGLLAAGISVASIDYRDTNVEPFPGPFEDAEMALRFIRFYAEQLGIDRTRIAGMGNEAGGNLALYLALQDDRYEQKIRDQLKAGDLDDPREILDPGMLRSSSRNGNNRNAEPLDGAALAQMIPWDAEAIGGASTKLKAAVALHPIATFDPRAWEPNKLPMNDHERLMTKYLDVRYLMPMNDAEIIKIVERVSPLSLISADDPPLLLISLYEDLPLQENTTWTIMRHHPKQSQLIAEAMKAKGNETIVRYKGMQDDPDIRSTQFLIDLLK